MRGEGKRGEDVDARGVWGVFDGAPRRTHINTQDILISLNFLTIFPMDAVNWTDSPCSLLFLFSFAARTLICRWGAGEREEGRRCGRIHIQCVYVAGLITLNLVIALEVQ